MSSRDEFRTIHQELEAGIKLPKCQRCGCLQETLSHLAEALPTIGTQDALALNQYVSSWIESMRPIQYACLGCEHCYPAVAQNVLAQTSPSLGQASALGCEFHVRDEGWPAVAGEYVVLDKNAPVAVSTLADVYMAEVLASRQPNGLAIVGKTETENIGIDKVVKNVITNPALRYLIVAGLDPKGHHPGKSLIALAQNGVDINRRIIGSPGRRPSLRNVSAAEIQVFRVQVQVIDMIGCDDAVEIHTRVEALCQQAPAACDCHACAAESPLSVSTAPRLTATEATAAVKLDKAGYFVIIPRAEQGVISVEHYAYDNMLLHIIEGPNARVIYSGIIHHGWVTELSHAAYLGKELARAELSLQFGFKYIQDGA
jgi:tetrahydromethanopterin S-methyltransferase subunit A